MSGTKVVIKTQSNLGFCCWGVVLRLSDRRAIHVTREYPYGMDNVAHTAAQNWAETHGYREVDSEE